MISAYISRHMTYTNGVTIVITAVGANNAQTSYSLIGDDFGGIVYNNGATSNITVKKAGTYEINNNGNITTRKFNANDTFTLPNNNYSIRKIK